MLLRIQCGKNAAVDKNWSHVVKNPRTQIADVTRENSSLTTTTTTRVLTLANRW